MNIVAVKEKKWNRSLKLVYFQDKWNLIDVLNEKQEIMIKASKQEEKAV